MTMFSVQPERLSSIELLAQDSKSWSAYTIRLLASLAIAIALVQPSAADSDSSVVASISDDGLRSSVNGGSAGMRGSVNGGSAGMRGSVNGGSAGMRGNVSLGIGSIALNPQNVRIVGTVEAADSILGTVQIEGQAVYVGSAYVGDDLAVGAVVSVFGVSSLDGTLVLAEDVTVLTGSDSHDLSDHF